MGKIEVKGDVFEKKERANIKAKGKKVRLFSPFKFQRKRKTSC